MYEEQLRKLPVPVEWSTVGNLGVPLLWVCWQWRTLYWSDLRGGAREKPGAFVFPSFSVINGGIFEPAACAVVQRRRGANALFGRPKTPVDPVPTLLLCAA